MPAPIDAHAYSEAGPVAPHLQCPQGEFHTERRRFGMDAVRSPDHRRVAVFARPLGDRVLEPQRDLEDAVERARHLQRECRVDDIA